MNKQIFNIPCIIGHYINPEARTGSKKYSTKGLFTTASFNGTNLDNTIKIFLAETANMSLAQSTWSTYKTTKKHLRECEIETGTDLELPLDETKITIFLSWLLRTRCIKSTSADSYLAGLRKLHTINGLQAPVIRTDLVKTILTGAKNRDNIEERLHPKPKRLPLTLTALKLLGLELNNLNLQKVDIRMIWAVSCIAFFGSLRMGELLTEKGAHFDPLVNLLTEDVLLSRDPSQGSLVLQINIKAPKEDRKGKAVIIDIFQNEGECCPIQAFQSWQKMKPPRRTGMPMFCFANGAPFTQEKMNKILKVCMQHNIPEGAGYYSGHSFRAGIPSMLGQMGYSDGDIRTVGRWSSNSHEHYMKLPRTKRQKISREIAGLNL